ncbi:hypothetical protein ILUMI_01267 [Ignelater luminosus]|uniref:MAPK regulated corepressor interacting protein 2 n=1 Tax=Ignelater luminosus TaxID=2038154 RepID=A0A8K0DKB8_IGNLU|nr:hypothetical protein ILUMI_01267 [Ignelater luminosus]
MYNIKGPSKIVAKTTRRGISQNIESFRDTSKNMKSLDANDNEIVNGPKPVFHNNSKRSPLSHPRQQESITPQHEEIIKYIHESWLSISSDVDEGRTQTNTNRNRRGNSSVIYYEDEPCQHLQDFKPFDLESWWGKRLYTLITNSVNGKN